MSSLWNRNIGDTIVNPLNQCEKIKAILKIYFLSIAITTRVLHGTEMLEIQ